MEGYVIKTDRIDDSALVVQAVGLVAVDMDGETVMMQIENGKYYSLDPIGGRIWELLASPTHIDRLVEILTSEYEVEREQCKEDTLEFINYLYQEGLIQID